MKKHSLFDDAKSYSKRDAGDIPTDLNCFGTTIDSYNEYYRVEHYSDDYDQPESYYCFRRLAESTDF